MLLTHGGFSLFMAGNKEGFNKQSHKDALSTSLPIRNRHGNYTLSYVNYLFGTFHIFIQKYVSSYLKCLNQHMYSFTP